MATNEPKYVTEPILTYYDVKIKKYIDEKAVQPQVELERRLDSVEKEAAINATNITAHREELDDLEQDVRDLWAAIENSGGGCGVTKEYVDTAIETAIDSLNIPDTNSLVTKDELSSALEELPTEEDLKRLTEFVANVEASLEEKADREDIPSIVGLASEIYVDEKVTALEEATETAVAGEADAREALAVRVKTLEDFDNATQEELDTYKIEVTTAIATAKSEAIADTDDKLATKVSSEDFETFKGENTTAIAAAQAQADKGVADAKTANDAIAALSDGAVATNTSDISAMKTRLTNLETAKGDHETRIVTAEGNITALQNKDSELAGLITSLQTDKADQDSVYTKTEADASFMTQTKVDDRINALIVSADPEGGKVITNIQNLVKYVDENASDIAALVTATSANTDKLVGIDSTVKNYVDTSIAGLVTPKGSEEVTVAEDGTLGLGHVSIDKLVIGTDTFVIDAGSAN